MGPVGLGPRWPEQARPLDAGWQRRARCCRGSPGVRRAPPPTGAAGASIPQWKRWRISTGERRKRSPSVAAWVLLRVWLLCAGVSRLMKSHPRPGSCEWRCGDRGVRVSLQLLRAHAHTREDSARLSEELQAGPTAVAPFPRSRAPQPWLGTPTPPPTLSCLDGSFDPSRMPHQALLPATTEQEWEGLGAPERPPDAVSKTLPRDQLI